ncbi:hypothetical protein vBSalMSz_82 [Salmonella phage vB_SalM_Sz]|nr:hypothetical protein P350_000006 [Escherichia phage vB_EcoM_SD350]
MYSAKCEDGIYTVYCDGKVLKVLPNAFKFEQFMTVLWENQEISREDIIDLMNPLMGYHPIREFDSRPTWYKLEDGKVWEQAWDRFEGSYGHWTVYVDGDDAQKYWEAIKNCVTRDVTDPEYDESKFEVK